MRARPASLICLACAVFVVLTGCPPSGGQPGAAAALCEEARTTVCWPRFPPQDQARALPKLAVFLSAGGINQNTTLARLGYPDRLLFGLHRELPRLNVVLVGSPANRYSGERDVTRSPDGAATWKALGTEPRFGWIEIAGEGFTHSPPGDTILSHHEFAVDQTGCNLDHTRMGTPEYCRERLQLVRQAYEAIGLPQGRIVLIRFPGLKDSPAALSAASEAGFLALLGNRHQAEAGRPWWISHPSGEILDLENTKLGDLVSAATGSRGAEPDPGIAMSRVEKTIEQGGVLNLRADLQDLFRENGEPTPACRFLMELLRRVDERYGPEVWYPRGGDLALWMDLRRHSRVTVSESAGVIEARLAPPEPWAAAGRGLDTAAVCVRVPEEWDAVSGITVAEGDGPDEAVPSWRWFWAGPRLVVIPFPASGPLRVRVSGA